MNLAAPRLAALALSVFLVGCADTAPPAEGARDEAPAAAAPPAAHSKVHVNPSLHEIVEVASAEWIEPAGNNRLEVVVRLTNVTTDSAEVQSKLTWLGSAGGMRGGQTNDHVIPPGGDVVVTAPTRDRRISDYRMTVGPIVRPAIPQSARAQSDALVVSASAPGDRGEGVLSISSPNDTVEYRVVIDDPACRRFRLRPSGECEAVARTPAGATTTFLVAYEPTDERTRRGRLTVDFDDPAREDVVVELEGRLGSGPQGRRRIELQ